MTNFERIKNMSVEELAELFEGVCCARVCALCPLFKSCGGDYIGENGWEEWLESEVADNER